MNTFLISPKCLLKSTIPTISMLSSGLAFLSQAFQQSLSISKWMFS